jgi:ribosome-associated toxin RatA of RatAB toxin-antitoxin module
MPTISRSALVRRPALAMFELVHDVAAYPRRFDWCESAAVLERFDDGLIARLAVKMGPMRTSFTTRNVVDAGRCISLSLVDGPFRRLSGRWDFTALGEGASKVELQLDFEAAGRVVGSALALGFQSLADRMVDDFVREAQRLAA